MTKVVILGVIPGVILGVILRVAYVILMRKVALSEQIGRDLIFWKCLPCNVNDKLCSILSYWKFLPMELTSSVWMIYMILMTEIVLGDDSYDKSCDPKVILAGTLYFGNVYQCS